jgi:hypothetical protein
MDKKRRYDVASLLLLGMVVALLPGLFTSEIKIGPITVRSEQWLLGYCMVAMAVIGIAGALEARRKIAAAFRSRRRGWAYFLKMTWVCVIWAYALSLCAFVLWKRRF